MNEEPIDFFTVLGLPRRAWLEAETVTNAFHLLAKVSHPDYGRDAAGFQRLTTAYRVLSDHSLRLRHLLDLAKVEPLEGAPRDAAFQDFQWSAMALLTKPMSHSSERQESAVHRANEALRRRKLHKELLGFQDQSRALGERLIEKLRRVDVADLSALQEIHQQFVFFERVQKHLWDALVELRIEEGKHPGSTA